MRKGVMRCVKQRENEGKIKQGSDQRKTIYKISFKMGILNEKRCKSCLSIQVYVF